MKNSSVVFVLLISISIGSVARTANLNDVCETPNLLRGTCIYLRQCPDLFAWITGPRPIPNEMINLLRRSQCGSLNREPLVCCRVNDTTKVAKPPAARNVSTHPNVGLVNPEFCGQATVKRIIGGNKTSVFEFPWMALLSYKIGSDRAFKCGGTLINSRYVLTAAHCLSFKKNLELVSVRLGDHDISTETDCELETGVRVCAPPYQDIDIEEAHKHPLYDRNKIINDIALLRLARPADLTQENVVPICLPVSLADQTNDLDRKRMLVAGWGVTEEGTTSLDLLKVFIPISSHDECKETYRREFNLSITEGQLCALEPNLKLDSCNGDSGGPLKRYGVIQSMASMIQYGIVSYGHRNCGTAGVPSVYTRVGHYMDWILDTIRP